MLKDGNWYSILSLHKQLLVMKIGDVVDLLHVQEA